MANVSSWPSAYASSSSGTTTSSSSSSPSSRQQQQRSRPIDDGARVTYSWLPHSTAAISASSTVALHVRSALILSPPPLAAGGGGAVECRVEASVHGMGSPLQCCPVSSRIVRLVVNNSSSSSSSSSKGAGTRNRHHSLTLPQDDTYSATTTTTTTPPSATTTATNNDDHWSKVITFDTMLRLPVRWRDLPRDACVTLDVHCNYSTNNIQQQQQQLQLQPPSSSIYGTTLPLFDEYGKLRRGLIKLRLYPSLLGDGGMSYQLYQQQQQSSSSSSSSSAINDDDNNREDEGGNDDGGEGSDGGVVRSVIDSFLNGGATPGIIDTDDNNNNSNNEMVDDPKWTASLILHELDHQLESSLPGSVVGDRSGSGVGGNSSNKSNRRSISWLDAMTRARCLDILHESEDENGGDDYDNVYSNSGDNAGGGGGGGGGVVNIPSSHLQQQKQQKQQRDDNGSKGASSSPPPPTSSQRSYPYLIVELPTTTLPILYEEPIYPVETSSHTRGTTGSITASELIKFHSLYRTEDEDDDNVGMNGLTVRISPHAMIDDTKVSSSSSSSSSLLPSAIAFLYPLVQTLDYEPPLAEENPTDNPAQDKYRILAHDLIRGLVDPGLKPDRAQRSRLERIVSSPSYHLTTDEKDLLWRFRFSLVDERRALTKFLLAVDWTVESEVVQAAELLEQWKKRSPIEVTDALKLLGRNVAFQTGLVRSYAIETLANAPDEELRLYLLQLVQALKYEEDVSGGSAQAGNVISSSSATTTASTSSRVSSLSAFLIDRASTNIELANYLFWYLRVELENRTYESRYREVFVAFQERLSETLASEDGTIIPPGGHQTMSPESTTSNVVTLWDLFSRQESFVSGILRCQLDSQCVRGKKDAKEKHLREALAVGGFHDISYSVPLPSAPHIWVKGVDCNSAKMFKSALYPAVLSFIVDSTKASSSNNSAGGRVAGTMRQQSSKANIKTMYKVMIKTGDDLRQDQLVIIVIQLMDRLLKRGTLDLCLRPYAILAMPNNTGLIEFVEQSIPISQILSSNNNSIMAYFQSVALQDGAPHSVKPDVLQTYIRSCAGYCVLTYLLGVGDRHLDNIMIQPTGHFFHIDFGFIFGRDPKPLPPAFRLTKEMVDGMGGTDSKEYRQFCALACQAFNVLRKSAGLVLNLLHLMSDAGIEDLSHNPSADPIGVIMKVEERFKLEMTDEQAEVFFVGLINESLSALAPRVMEMFHQLAVARR